MGGFYAPFYKIIAQCEICKHQSHIRYEKYILNKKIIIIIHAKNVEILNPNCQKKKDMEMKIIVIKKK